MTTIRDQVTEFHVAVGQPILKSPQVPDDKRVELRAALIMEEAFEVLESLMGSSPYLDHLKHETLELCWLQEIKVDLEKLADGLADLDYVVEGTRLEFGINGEPIAAEVHRANMTKLDGPKRADGKQLKPQNWIGPRIKEHLDFQKQECPGCFFLRNTCTCVDR